MLILCFFPYPCCVYVWIVQNTRNVVRILHIFAPPPVNLVYRIFSRLEKATDTVRNTIINNVLTAVYFLFYVCENIQNYTSTKHIIYGKRTLNAGSDELSGVNLPSILKDWWLVGLWRSYFIWFGLIIWRIHLAYVKKICIVWGGFLVYYPDVSTCRTLAEILHAV